MLVNETLKYFAFHGPFVRYHYYYVSLSTDLSVVGGVVGELVFKLLNAFSHLCLVLPVEPFDIFRLLTPSGWPASPAPNSSFCKSKRTTDEIYAPLDWKILKCFRFSPNDGRFTKIPTPSRNDFHWALYDDKWCRYLTLRR